LPCRPYVIIHFAFSTTDAIREQPDPSAYWSGAWSDEDVFALIDTAPPLPEAVFTLSGSPELLSSIFVICADTVAKRGSWGDIRNEVKTLEFVRDHTSIPVPKIRRFLRGGVFKQGYLIMEKIEGSTLKNCWHRLATDQRWHVVSTLKTYINELREVSAKYYCFPGPMGSDRPVFCQGATDVYGVMPPGPFKTSGELIAYFNELKNPPPLEDSLPFVLTHNDLSMRNIILGSDQKVWMIDWGWSGFYPSWCEYLAMGSSARNDKAPQEWRDYIPEVTGDWSYVRGGQALGIIDD
jgi:hypothetical protein